MGRSTDRWRASQAGIGGFAGYRIAVHAPPWARPGMSWRTFLRNQATAFAIHSEHRSEGSSRLRRRSSWTALARAAALQLAQAHLGFRRSLGQRPISVNARLSLSSSVRCNRVPMHRAQRRAAAMRRTTRARLAASATTRSPPHQARASPIARCAEARIPVTGLGFEEAHAVENRQPAITFLIFGSHNRRSR